MRFDDVLHDRESKPASADRARAVLVDAIEAFEDPALVIFRYPDSVVDDAHDKLALAEVELDGHRSISTIILDRILDEVHNRLLQSIAIAICRAVRIVTTNDELEIDAGHLCCRLHFI